MTILKVVQDVTEVVGVLQPTSIFTNITQNRTMQEMLALANEMAQRIGCDAGHDWTVLKKLNTYTGNGTQTAFNLPADYKRMLLTANVRSSTAPRQPLRFIPDFDEWTARRLSNQGAGGFTGEWTMAGGQVLIYPAPATDVTITFPYLDKNCVVLSGGGVGNEFIADTDSFRLDERLLKLGMIWQWKANKGSPYAEDMGTYGDALATLMGKDQPASIIIDRYPISASAQVSGSWPATWGPQP
jgi:hypothetical protein